MTTIVEGNIELTAGSHSLHLRPAGRTVYLDVPTWRAGWNLLRAMWSQRPLVRWAKTLLAEHGVTFVVRYRDKEVYRINPNQEPE